MRIQNSYENPTGMTFGVTFGVQLLLILNIGAFVLEYFLGVRLSRFCALHADWLNHGAFWQLITYQFIHQGFRHILFNMLALFFLGADSDGRFFPLATSPVSEPRELFLEFSEPTPRSTPTGIFSYGECFRSKHGCLF